MVNEELLYEGKAKKIYRTNQENQLRVKYLDQLTALNGKRKDVCEGKGALTNTITSAIFEELNQKQFPTHFIKKTSKTEQLVEKLDMIPLEVVVRNVAAGSFATRFQLPDSPRFSTPIVEYYYKNDALDDPFINEDHIFYLQLVTKEELDCIREQALTLNHALLHYFSDLELDLIDFKLEFGYDHTRQIKLGDEISPDTCRLQDRHTKDSLDKDIYRKQTGNVVQAYQEISRRIQQKKETISHVSY